MAKMSEISSLYRYIIETHDPILAVAASSRQHQLVCPAVITDFPLHWLLLLDWTLRLILPL